MSYKMTRKDNAITEFYGKVDIVSTIDNDTLDYYIDIVYHGTDVGITFVKTDKKNYLKDLAMMEAYCQGYNQALEDMWNNTIKG